MEERLLSQAKRSLQLADHLLIGTYHLVKDPKLLLGVLSNIYDANKNIIAYALHKKTIPLKTSNAQLEQFKQYFKKEITKEEMTSITAIQELFNEHKSSAVEFARKQKLVMCDDHYTFQSITFETLKPHLNHAKSIQKKLLNI